MPLINENAKGEVTPYRPYTPEFQTLQKRLAANRSNQVQGKMGSRYGSDFGRFYASYAPSRAGSSRIAVTNYGGVNIPSPQYPYPQVQNPPYYQLPTPPNAVNYEKAIADTPEENKEYARNVLNAYRQFLGREADEPGYFAHLHRAIREKANWEQIANWLRESEEGQRYQAMRDVGLQVDPELLSRRQEYERWLKEQELQKAFLAEQLRQGTARTQLNYQTQMEDLARAVAAEQENLRNEMIRRGIWQSGITDKNLQDIAQKEMLARGRIGAETALALSNLEGTYGTNLGTLAQRMGQYGQQYNEAVADLMRRREALVGKTLEEQLRQRQEEAWRRQMYDWEREKFYTNLAAQQAMRSGYGGGGYGRGGYGGGSGSGEVNPGSPGGWQKISEQARLIMGQGGTPEDVIRIFTQQLMVGRPGLDMKGVSADDLASWLQYSADTDHLGLYNLYNSDYKGLNQIARGLQLRARQPNPKRTGKTR